MDVPDVVTSLAFLLDAKAIDRISEASLNLNSAIRRLDDNAYFWKSKLENEYAGVVGNLDLSAKEYKILYQGLERLSKTKSPYVNIFHYIDYFDDTVNLTRYLVDLYRKSKIGKNAFLFRGTVGLTHGDGVQYVIRQALAQKSYRTVDILHEMGALCDRSIFNFVYEDTVRKENVEGAEYIKRLCAKK